MNSSMRKTTVREIKNSFGRFMAILAIIALGVGFFSGLKITKPSMIETADNYLKETDFFDYRLISTLGFTPDNVNEVGNTNGVKSACGAVYQDFLYCDDENKEVVLKAHSISYDINKLSVIEGEMPSNDNECVLDSKIFSSDKIGSVISLSNNIQDITDKFTYKEYIVTGLVQSPYYLNYERGNSNIGDGSVYGCMYIPIGGFTSKYFSEIFVRFESSPYIFSPEYDELSDSMKQPLTDICQKCADSRYDKIKDDAYKNLSEVEEKYNSEKAQYENSKNTAQQQLDTTYNEMTNSQNQIINSEQLLIGNEQTLNANLSSVQDSLNQINVKRYELAQQQQQQINILDSLYSQQSELEKDIEQISYLISQIIGKEEHVFEERMLQNQKTELEQNLYQVKAQISSLKGSQTQVNAGIEQLNTKQTQLEASYQQIQSAITQLQSKKNQIQSAKNQLTQSEQQYNFSKQQTNDEFSDAESKFISGQIEIDNAKAEIENIAPPEIYVLNRETNTGYVCFKSDSEIVEAVSVVFPIFFFLVAALVCVTTMNRMIDEQRTQIGILKALGYSNKTIMSKYIIYSGSAAVIGCILGLLAGTYIFPTVIWKAYSMMYKFAPIKYVFDLKLVLISLAAALACSVGVTCYSCYKKLFSVPALLIRPKSPKAGKRILLEKITFIWKRLTFLHKVSIRNIFRYKKRFVMMILGISGCTALLLTGFGMKDSVANIGNLQYGEILKYNYEVAFSDPQNESSIETFTYNNSDIADDTLFIYRNSIDLVTDKGIKSILTVIPKNSENIASFICFETNDNQIIEYPNDNEAVISSGIARDYSINIGDTVTLRDSNFNEINVTISGICKNYVNNYIYISKETYINQINKAPEYKLALVNQKNETDNKEVSARLTEYDGVSGVFVIQSIKERIEDMMSCLNYVVLLIVTCAGLLVFIVLYNLTNINITERIREIATIKVLGFNAKETSSYVFRENLFLTLIGAVIGLGLGIALHSFVMSKIIVDMVNFDRIISTQSFILSIILTFVFACIVDIILYFKLNKIDMAQALKSIE